MWNTWLLALPGGSSLTPNPAILGLLHTQRRISNPRFCGGNDDGDVDALMVLTRMVITNPTAYTAEKHMFAQCAVHTHMNALNPLTSELANTLPDFPLRLFRIR